MLQHVGQILLLLVRRLSPHIVLIDLIVRVVLVYLEDGTNGDVGVNVGGVIEGGLKTATCFLALSMMTSFLAHMEESLKFLARRLVCAREGGSGKHEYERQKERAGEGLQLSASLQPLVHNPHIGSSSM